MQLIRTNTFIGMFTGLLALPVAVHGQFSFTTNNGALTVTGYSGPGGAVIIPAQTNGLPVASIGTAAFIFNTSISAVSIPESITNIGDVAFASCSGLTNVTIPNASIGSSSFANCFGLINVTVGTGVTSIASSAFQNTGMTNVTIPSSVTNLGLVIFHGCTSLNTITVDPLNAFYASENGVLFDKSKTTLMEYPGGKLGPVAIPRSVTTIDVGAFEYINLTNITIPESVTNIARAAFYSCSNLVGVFFAGNAPTIDPTAFLYDNAVLYYLPGTLGWSGVTPPVVLWNPQMQTTDTSFGVKATHFGFNITGTTNIPLVVEASTDVGESIWVPLQTCTLTNGSVYFTDQWNYPTRFYRIRSP